LKRVLLVDDDPDIRALVSAALGHLAGYEVKSCSSARECLSAAESFRPDLILLDVMMPEADGLSALEALRRLEATRDTPVVFVTASAQPSDLARYRQLGCLGVIRKPFNPVSLPDTLESLCQAGRAPRTPSAAAEFEELRRTYLAELPQRLDALQEAARALAAIGWDRPTVETMYHLTHRLAGSAGLYRLGELSRTAGLLEQIVKRLLGSPTWPPASSPAELTTLVKAVRRCARSETRQAHAAAAAAAAPAPRVSPR
jgi:CheY-like chemotaxis protein